MAPTLLLPLDLHQSLVVEAFIYLPPLTQSIITAFPPYLFASCSTVQILRALDTPHVSELPPTPLILVTFAGFFFLEKADVIGGYHADTTAKLALEPALLGRPVHDLCGGKTESFS